MNRILTILVTYNGSKWIENCLNSILDSSLKSDIFIVDNCSNDNTIQIIEEKYSDSVLLYKSEINLGFGKGNNLGLKHALINNYDYVFLLNQDAFLEKETLKRMIKVSESNNEYGVLSPIHLNDKGNKLEMYFSDFVGYQNNPHFYSDFLIKNVVQDVYDFQFISAAAWLLPIETLRKIGGFDPIFWHYGEDDNYCQRVLYHNLKIGVVTNTFIKHDTIKRQYNEDYRYTKRYFQDFEKDLQVKYGNVNFISNINVFHYERKKLIKSLLLSFIEFDRRKTVSLISKLKSLKGIFIQIYDSRKINAGKGSNYLE
jgi:GT2 family glycosyltransferase